MENNNEIKETMVTSENITDKEVVKPLVDVEKEEAAAKAAEENPGFFKKVGNSIKANKGKLIGGTAVVLSAVGGFVLGKKIGVKSMLSSMAQATTDDVPEEYIPEETDEDQVSEEEI